MSTKEYHDYIDFEQEAVTIIKDPELVSLFYTEGYWAVLAILREEPLTVKDITIKTNELIVKKVLPKIEESIENWEIPRDKEKLGHLLKKFEFPEKERKEIIEKEKLSSEDIIKIKGIAKQFKLEKEKKSEKTIYRYIKELTDVGLVIPAGRRIIKDQTATEAIYSRKAKIFLLREHADETWKCEICHSTLEKVSKLIGLSTRKEPPSIENLAKLMSSIDTFHEEEQIRLFEQYEDKVKGIIKDCSFKETNRMLTTFRMIYILMNHEEFKKELDACCK